MENERPSGALQESILTALGYGGKDASIITTIVSLEHFDAVYRGIAARIIDYRNRHGEAPGAAHLDDLFDDMLADKSAERSRTTRRILIGMGEQYPGLNLNYVINRIRDFARTQTLKNGVMAAAERWQEGGDELIPDIEKILNDTLKDRTNVVDPGVFFNDLDRVFLYQEKTEADTFLTNIGPIDHHGMAPHLGELDVFIAPPGRGKSWWCHHLGKFATRAGWNVLHITLENAETVVVPRYLQSYFAAARRKETARGVRFKKDEKGFLADNGVTIVDRAPEILIGDNQLRTKLNLNKWYFLDKLVVKQFPSGQLTLHMLENYLDYLDAYKGFQPKLVILDAPYLMKVDRRDYRLSLGQLLIELRGLAVQRNFALAATHQGNRDSSEARKVTNAHVAEDFSIIATADRILTYSQTTQERNLGMARLFAGKSRNEADQFTAMIAQNYATGQFALDSVWFKEAGYFDMVDNLVSQANTMAVKND